MKINRKKALVSIGLLILVALGMRSTLVGKITSVKSERRFNKLTVRNELVVVMFYDREKKKARDRKEREEQREYYDKLFAMFKSASKIFDYKEAEVKFLKVNLARKKAADLQHDFDIIETPTFMLFKDGSPVRDEKGAIAQLKGIVSREKLREFIDKYFEERIEEIMNQKEEIRRRRLEELRYRRYYYPYYYGYYPYYYRPYWGFGFGYGHGYHGW